MKKMHFNLRNIVDGQVFQSDQDVLNGHFQRADADRKVLIMFTKSILVWWSDRF